MPNKPQAKIGPAERDRLVNEAMRITQSREDLLRRNDELLTKLMRGPRYKSRKSKSK